MNGFKVGDRVRRKDYAFFKHDVGFIGIIECFPIPSTLRCVGDGPETRYAIEHYELVVDTPGPVSGRKDDGGKLDLTLLFDDCPHALEAVAEVLQWAVTKKLPKPYERGSWQHVDDFQRRYRAAMQRHMLNASKRALDTAGGPGMPFEETRDAETGLRELAHIATDAIFQLEMAIRKENGL